MVNNQQASSDLGGLVLLVRNLGIPTALVGIDTNNLLSDEYPEDQRTLCWTTFYFTKVDSDGNNIYVGEDQRQDPPSRIFMLESSGVAKQVLSASYRDFCIHKGDLYFSTAPYESCHEQGVYRVRINTGSQKMEKVSSKSYEQLISVGDHLLGITSSVSGIRDVLDENRCLGEEDVAIGNIASYGDILLVHFSQDVVKTYNVQGEGVGTVMSQVGEPIKLRPDVLKLHLFFSFLNDKPYSIDHDGFFLPIDLESVQYHYNDLNLYLNSALRIIPVPISLVKGFNPLQFYEIEGKIHQGRL